MPKRTKKRARKPTKGAYQRKATPAAQTQRRKQNQATVSSATLEIGPAEKFPFLSLPLEIQTEIFKWTRTHWGAQTPKSLIRTSRSMYEKFAPQFWQTSTISIKHPIKFANCLKNASPIFRHNIHHIRYLAHENDERFHGLYDDETFAEISPMEFPNDDFIRLRTDLRKLLKMLSAREGELAQRLQTFSIQVHPSSCFQIEVRHHLSRYPDADALWKLASDRCNKWFSAFEQKLIWGSLKGFQVSKTYLAFDHYSQPVSLSRGPVAQIKSLDMEFKRPPGHQLQIIN